jgi:hypothetical protein
MVLTLDVRELTHLGRDIEAVLRKQGGDATVESVHAEIVERIPRVEVLARALGADNVIDTMRKLDELIAKRMLSREIEGVLDKQGADTTLKSAHAEIVERIPDGHRPTPTSDGHGEARPGRADQEAGPASIAEFEVNARVVGSFDWLEAMTTLWPGGLFAYGKDPSGSGVFRFIVDAASEDDARAEVARLLLSVPGVVPHDIRVGPLVPVESPESDEDLEEQLESLLGLLTPEEARELSARLQLWARAAATETNIEKEQVRRATSGDVREMEEKARVRREEMKARARQARGWEDDDPPF